MKEGKKWYAVYTNPRWEKKVASHLTSKRIENYCPLHNVRRRWADRWKVIEEPVLLSYVFVRIERKDFIPVLRTSGVVNFVKWLGMPAWIRDEEMEEMKNFLHRHKEVKVESGPSVNDMVRVVGGSLAGHEGTVIETKNKTVKLVLRSLGIHLVAEVETTLINLIPAP